MTDKFRIDSQKIALHPVRVAEWISSDGEWEKLKSVYPIYVEIASVGACNHRCTFCSVDYLGYKTVSQSYETLLARIKEMGRLGVKSIMFAGEGEPALWKPLPDLLNATSDSGLDFAMTTNMVPFTPKNTESFVRNCTWIKASINGGDSGSYADIHKTRLTDFEKVLKNFEHAVNVREKIGSKCTLGGQMVLLPENQHTVLNLANRLKNTGADYFVVKPYTQSLYGISHTYEGLKYDDMMYLNDELEKLNDGSFNVVFRDKTMVKLNEQKQPYNKCYSTPVFWSYIMADGAVYSCGAHLSNEKFLLGNINESSFSDIWEGDKRRLNYEHIINDLCISDCRKNCRMDEVNRYLWELKNPNEHVNFI